MKEKWFTVVPIRAAFQKKPRNLSEKHPHTTIKYFNCMTWQTSLVSLISGEKRANFFFICTSKLNSCNKMAGSTIWTLIWYIEKEPRVFPIQARKPFLDNSCSWRWLSKVKSRQCPYQLQPYLSPALPTTEALISQQLHHPHPRPKGKNTSSGSHPRSIVNCVYAKVEKKLALFCDQESWGSGFWCMYKCR
jgi:hypothetical protein